MVVASNQLEASCNLTVVFPQHIYIHIKIDKNNTNNSINVPKYYHDYAT